MSTSNSMDRLSPKRQQDSDPIGFPACLSPLLLSSRAALLGRNNDGDKVVGKHVPFPWRQFPRGLCTGAGRAWKPGCLPDLRVWVSQSTHQQGLRVSGGVRHGPGGLHHSRGVRVFREAPLQMQRHPPLPGTSASLISRISRIMCFSRNSTPSFAF